jgi:hypothetical protein
MLSSLGVRLFREPDAGNLPVRFDEREQETGSSQTGLRRHGESPVSSHREAKTTAPVLDSTPHITQYQKAPTFAVSCESLKNHTYRKGAPL